MQTVSLYRGQAPPVWAIIKANITPEGRPHEEAFSAWYSAEHVPEYVAREGFSWGRRLRRVAAEGQVGEAEHEYLAVYAVDDVPTFNAALAAGPPWGPWHADIDRYVCDWERTYYRVIGEHFRDGGKGRYWALVKIDLDPAADEGEFDAWYSAVHLPEIASNPGFHRAWRLRVEPDANDLGERRQRYWAVYEVDDPECFVAAREKRFAAGTQAWDGVWADAVRNVQICFYELIFGIAHDDAREQWASR
jgi:hypothetical protein